MKKWQMVKGEQPFLDAENVFKDAPEWATAISSSGNAIAYEEKFGAVGARWQRVGTFNVLIYDEGSSNIGWEVVARLEEEKPNKAKRKKGPKLTPKTVSRVFIRYNDDTTYTIKNPITLRVENGFTIIVMEQKESADGAVVETKDVYIKNNSINLITIVAEHFISLLKYDEDLGSVTEIANGNFKVISKAEFNIQGNE